MSARSWARWSAASFAVALAACGATGSSGRESPDDSPSDSKEHACTPAEDHEPAVWPSTSDVVGPVAMMCPDALPSATVDVDCDRIVAIERLGVEQRHGAGLLAHVRLLDAGGGSLEEPYGQCLTLYDHTCTPVDVGVQHSLAPASTIVVVRAPADDNASSELRAAIEIYLALRPKDERIAVWQWGEAVTQIVAATTDRALIRRRVDASLVPRAVDHQSLTDAVRQAEASLQALDRHTHFGLRNVMVLAPDVDLGHERAGLRSRLRLEVLDRAVAAEHATKAGDSPWRALMTDASERLDRDRRAGRFAIAYCQSPEHGVAALRASKVAELLLDPWDVRPEERGATCVAADLLDPPVPPEYLELLLAPEQRLVYDQRVLTKSKEPFEASMRTSMSPVGAAAEVNVKLRGNNSLDCARKSYSINFAGHAPRHLIAGAASDEYFLVAMCLDDRYVNQFTGDQIMARFGAFPYAARLIELRLNGMSQGVYLLIEKPQDRLLASNSRVRLVARRATDIEGEPPELKYAAASDGVELAAYEGFLEETEQRHGIRRMAWLDAHLDLDQYLRWVATMSALQVGDFVDEAYFTGTETTNACGLPTHAFSVAGWDPDDLFAPCHHGGESALYDPYGLIYCAEARLDHAMFDEDAVYERYVEVLVAVLDELDEGAFSQALGETQAQLLGYLASEDIRAAMTELLDVVPEATAFDAMRAEIDGKVAWLHEAYRARAKLLRRRIADYQVARRH